MGTRRILAVVLSLQLITNPGAYAQNVSDCGCSWPAYRLQCQTIYEEQPVTTYRTVAETTMDERTVTTYRPVWETSFRERRYQVARPVQETSMREERHTVLRPVRETTYRDLSYNRVRYVSETQSRLERRVVQRPVVETQSREERVVVQRPVSETVFQDQVSTTMVPTTTFRQQVVDQGQFVDQFSVTPGPTRNRLRWLPGQCTVDPATQQTYYRWPGFHWVTSQQPGTVQVQRMFVSNPVVQQVPETTMVPQQVVQRVPVQVTRMQEEVQLRQVPVQTVRMVQEEEFREVPVTVQRPVVERVENKVPVEVCRWVPEEVVRQVPVTTLRMTYEDRVEQIPVRTCRFVAEQRVVQTPRTTQRLVAETSMRRVPRTVMVRVPIDPCTGAEMESAVPTTSWSTSIPYVTESRGQTTLKPPADDIELQPIPAEKSEPVDTMKKSTDDEWQESGPVRPGVRPILEGADSGSNSQDYPVLRIAPPIAS